MAANPKSRSRQADASHALPGGSTRAVLWYPPFPLAIARGEGCYVEDLDGHRYADLVSEYSAGLYGHSDPAIADALCRAIREGISLGAPNVYEARLAAAIVERFPAIERVRFCNSGTEANIMALSTARALTRREKVLVFHEGYHGGVLTFAHGGSRLNLPFPYVLGEYNKVESTDRAIRREASNLAAVIVEPMMGGGGCIPATPEFLSILRSATRDIGALLIFDEVMTSRLSYRGLHGELGIHPDLVTLGKYIGGGSSFGAFGGRADIMDRFDPSTPEAFPHGGTFNNNILSMVAGLTGLEKVLTREASARMNDLGDRLRAKLQHLLDRHQISAVLLGRGSLMNLHFVSGPVTQPQQLAHADRRHLQLWHLEMLARGQHVTPRGLLALSLPFGEDEADAFTEAMEDFVVTHKAVLPRTESRA
ncbi:aspartate aminotransferase family protein [Dongia deserti]|uniref:aspartate aminotransferase family protein n=1 Tax=Dongia deserti TaxID=2268030 RepID=UPI002548A616|nr:aminotransferase class III-fold pyridoxal phosphate-dependent enzyme [Dongia deserti]